MRSAHWLGRCLDTPSSSPSSAEGNGGEGASGRQGWAGGCAFSLGRLKGKFMLSVPASRGNTMSLQHVGRCIYSTRRLRLGLTCGQTWDPMPPQAGLSLTSGLHGTAPGQGIPGLFFLLPWNSLLPLWASSELFALTNN